MAKKPNRSPRWQVRFAKSRPSEQDNHVFWQGLGDEERHVLFHQWVAAERLKRSWVAPQAERHGERPRTPTHEAFQI